MGSGAAQRELGSFRRAGALLLMAVVLAGEVRAAGPSPSEASFASGQTGLYRRHLNFLPSSQQLKSLALSSNQEGGVVNLAKAQSAVGAPVSSQGCLHPGCRASLVSPPPPLPPKAPPSPSHNQPQGTDTSTEQPCEDGDNPCPPAVSGGDGVMGPAPAPAPGQGEGPGAAPVPTRRGRSPPAAKLPPPPPGAQQSAQQQHAAQQAAQVLQIQQLRKQGGGWLPPSPAPPPGAHSVAPLVHSSGGRRAKPPQPPRHPPHPSAIATAAHNLGR